jgi:multisubunit Na+/H+ antiporter MnhE subunit
MITVTHVWQFILWVGFYSELAHFCAGALVASPLMLTTRSISLLGGRSRGIAFILMLCFTFSLGWVLHLALDFWQPWF